MYYVGSEEIGKGVKKAAERHTDATNASNIVGYRKLKRKVDRFLFFTQTLRHPGT
jgi:hypothetical protein